MDKFAIAPLRSNFSVCLSLANMDSADPDIFMSDSTTDPFSECDESSSAATSSSRAEANHSDSRLLNPPAAPHLQQHPQHFYYLQTPDFPAPFAYYPLPHVLGTPTPSANAHPPPTMTPQAQLLPSTTVTPPMYPTHTRWMHSPVNHTPNDMFGFTPAHTSTSSLFSTNNLTHHTMTMEQLKLNFVSGLFDGIRIKPGLESSTVPQKVFEWEGFEKVTTEDRLLVVIRSMRQAGFALLGLLLAALFDRRANYNKHTTVYMSISKFLQCQSIELSTHPLAIVDMIYHHKYSQNFIDRRPEHPHFTLPRYAQPPSLRLRRILSPPYKNTTHNALLNWSLLRMIDHVDKEASLLVDPQLSLVLLPSTKLVWDMLLKWSATESQEKIATEVPALFALLSTIAVNKRTCQRLETAATGSESAPHSPDLEGIDVAAEDSDSDMEVPTENQEFADTLSGICHDPWLGVTITVLVLLFFQYRFAIVFATLMGVFLFTCNANRDIISVFGRLGFSISHKTILAILHVLAVDSDRHLRFWGAATQSGELSGTSTQSTKRVPRSIRKLST